MQFNYIAVNKQGEKIKGLLDAPSEVEARFTLRSQQLRPLSISKASALEIDLTKIIGFSKVKGSDVLLFTRQLHILISSGIPLVQGLDLIAEQIQNAAMKSIILSTKEKISQGGFLWQSLAAYKDVFPEIYINMVKAGEASGNLDIILQRLIKYLDDIEKLKKLVKGAMIYPIVITLVGLIVVIVMMTFVIPKFEALLQSSNQSLPAPTQFVINVSHFFQSNILFIVGGIVLGIYFIRYYLKTKEGRRFWDFYSLQLPLFGPLFLKVAVSRFSRTMQTLLSSGINLLDALEICREAVGNKSLEESLTKIKIEVEKGKTLSGVMSKLTIFPSMVIQMVTVGENTGNLDKMLERVADFYEEEVQGLVGNLTKLIEPLVLVVLGGTVGGLMIAMYLPIFKMAGGG